MPATGKGAGPQSEVCRELKTAGFLAIGPLGDAIPLLSSGGQLPKSVGVALFSAGS